MGATVAVICLADGLDTMYSRINMYGKRPFLTATSEPNDHADLQCLIYGYPLVSQVTFAAATGIRTCSVDR